MKIILYLFLFLVFSCSNYHNHNKVNENLNLNFESPHQFGASGWRETSSKMGKVIRSNDCKAGEFCYEVTSYVGSDTSILVSSLIPVPENSNIIEIECYTKKNNIGVDTFNLEVRAFSIYDFRTSIVNNTKCTVEGKQGWQKQKVSLELDSISGVFVFGIETFNDNFLIDDFHIKINSKPLEDHFSVLQSDIKKLEQKSIDIEPDNLETLNLEFFSNYIDDNKVIALGESTHGTMEIFQTKVRIIKYLVEKQGYNTIIFEGDMESHYRINELLRTNIPTDSIVKNMFEVYQTKEMKELMDWVRKMNRSKNKNITFWGNDAQESKYNLLSLKEFAKAKDDTLMLLIIDYENEYRVYESVDLTEKIKDHINKKEDEYLSKISKEKFNRLKLNVELLKQSIIFDANIGNRSIHRDSCMANNIIWILDNYPKSKSIIWAHNSHVAKSDKNKMGYLLAKKLKNQYFNIGFALNKGKYRAKCMDEYTEADLRLPFLGS